MSRISDLKVAVDLYDKLLEDKGVNLVRLNVGEVSNPLYQLQLKEFRQLQTERNLLAEEMRQSALFMGAQARMTVEADLKSEELAARVS